MDLLVHAFSDLHGHLFEPEVVGTFPGARFAALAAEVAASQARHPATPQLFVGAGDDHAGGSPCDVFWPDAAAADPAYAWFDEARVDAITLGNHDLDLGADLLARKLARLRHTRVVATNLAPGGPLDGVVVSQLQIDRAGRRLLLLGLLSARQTVAVATGEITLTDPIASARNALRTLAIGAAEPPRTAIVILSHLGNYTERIDDLPTDSDLLSMLAEERAAWPACPPVLVIAAHTHRQEPPPGITREGPTILLQPGAYGTHLGEAVLHHGTFRASVRPVAPVQGWATLDQALLHQLAAARGRYGQAILLHPDLSIERPALDACRGESAHLNLLCDLHADAPITGATDHGADTASLCALCVRTLTGRTPLEGAIGLDAWYRLLAFADRAAWVEIPWSCLPALLETLAARLDRPPVFLEHHGFLHFDRRLRYRLHRTGDRWHVRDLRYDDAPYAPERFRTLRLHSTTYLAAGLGGFADVFTHLGLNPANLNRTLHPVSLRDHLFGKLLQSVPLDPDQPLRDGRLFVTRESSSSG